LYPAQEGDETDLFRQQGQKAGIDIICRLQLAIRFFSYVPVGKDSGRKSKLKRSARRHKLDS